MSAPHPGSIVVTGTDTGVGKSVLSALLLLALDGGYWKPIQAGTEEETDSEAIVRMTGLPIERIIPEAYRLAAPASPDQAAEREGVTIDLDTLNLPAGDRPLVVEGAGGVLVPVADGLTFADLFARWALPVVIAARSGLGTLNHTLLTLEALERRGVRAAGVVLIGDEHQANERSLGRYTDVPIVGRVRRLERLDREELLKEYRDRFIPIEQWRDG